MRRILTAAYLDYFNNYLTAKAYGEANGLTEEEATEFLCIARKVALAKHPDA